MISTAEPSFVEDELIAQKPCVKKHTVGDFHNHFLRLISKQKVEENCCCCCCCCDEKEEDSMGTPLPGSDTNNNVIEKKSANAANGLETSTFTIALRIRPLLPH